MFCTRVSFGSHNICFSKSKNKTMKAFKTFVLTFTMLASMMLWNSSCKKEISVDPQADNPGLSSIRNAEPGFAENDMVIYWNDKATAVLGTVNPPPNQTRQFAMVQIAVHDALNTIKPKYESFALVNRREKYASPDAAVASAAYWSLKRLVPSTSLPIDDWYNQSLATIPDGTAKELGKMLGKEAATAILANRATDGFAQANAVVFLPDATTPGGYRSTLPYSNLLLGLPKVKAIPNWGTAMRPFSVTSNSQFRPSAPYSPASAEYVQDFNEVKIYGAREMHTRTADETEIGFFWVERSSTAWNRFTRNVVATKKMDAWKTARLFALLNTAMADAITGTFEAKYHYFYWRPETAIRLADDGNPLTPGNPGWLPSSTEIPAANPLMNAYTPPMPDYPSAHASLGGAAAEILKSFFGTDAMPVDQTSGTLPGVTRHYNTFSQAARDNSISRIYVGYHFRKACMAGEEQGKQIGSYVFSHSFRTNED
jgi:hypothetical protein